MFWVLKINYLSRLFFKPYMNQNIIWGINNTNFKWFHHLYGGLHNWVLQCAENPFLVLEGKEDSTHYVFIPAICNRWLLLILFYFYKVSIPTPWNIIKISWGNPPPQDSQVEFHSFLEGIWSFGKCPTYFLTLFWAVLYIWLYLWPIL